MKKVIVTGSEGFIGRSLVAELERRGVSVTGIDRRSGIEAYDYFSRTRLDGVDTVIHLAAQTSVFNDNRTDIARDNMDLFRAVCDRCCERGVKLVYASSSCADVSNSTSLYGISKRFCEEYARCYNPSATGIRFHNVYGSDPRKGTLLWHLLNDGKAKLYNGGRNLRHFTYIDDILEGIITACGSDDVLLNCRNPEKVSTLYFALQVKRYKGIDFETVEEMREFDKIEQEVNKSIKTIPLRYRSVAEGIHEIFYTEYK